MTRPMTEETDWVAWHDRYENPASTMSRRLALVQRRVSEALDALPAGPLRAVSMCAGQGRDLLGVLADHPRAGDVAARLVELDEANVAWACRRAAEIGRSDLEIVAADASDTAAYEGAVPANLVLACGIFGNVSDSDIERTLRHLPALCAPGAFVVWTRHPKDPEMLPRIDAWFVDAGFERIALDGDVELGFGVGAHRLTIDPAPYEPGVTLFTFVR